MSRYLQLTASKLVKDANDAIANAMKDGEKSVLSTALGQDPGAASSGGILGLGSVLSLLTGLGSIFGSRGVGGLLGQGAAGAGLLGSLAAGTNLIDLIENLIVSNGILALLIYDPNGLLGLGLGQVLWYLLCVVAIVLDYALGYSIGVADEETHSASYYPKGNGTRYALLWEALHCYLLYDLDPTAHGGYDLDAVSSLYDGIAGGLSNSGSQATAYRPPPRAKPLANAFGKSKEDEDALAKKRLQEKLEQVRHRLTAFKARKRRLTDVEFAVTLRCGLVMEQKGSTPTPRTTTDIPSDEIETLPE